MIQQGETPEFNEEHLLQYLAHYFHAPNPKPLSPTIMEVLKNPINKLKYIYNYGKTQYNKQIASTLLYEVYEQKQRTFEEIVKSNLDTKMLVGRLISIGNVLGEWIYKQRVNNNNKGLKDSKVVEQECVGIVVKGLQRMDDDDALYIINKLIVLGYSCLLIQDKPQLLLKYCHQILKKRTIYINLFKLGKYQTLKKMIQLEEDKSKIVSLMESPQFKPNDAIPFIRHILLGQLKVSGLQQVLVWWVQGVDQYIPKYQIHFRTNILSLLIKQNKTIQQYTCQISLGIQRRLLGNENSRNCANMVWKYLGDQIQIPISSHNGQLFQNQNEGQVIKHQSSQQTDHKEENKQKVVIEQQTNIQSQVPKRPLIQEIADEEQQTQEHQQYEFEGLKAPRNLYDCILGIRNPLRRKLSLKVLPNIIRRNPQDLIFSWQDLAQQLLFNLNQQTTQSLLAMFVTRPTPFIDSVGNIFFGKECSINDKVMFMKVINDGIQQLSHKPKQIPQEEESSQFYFKKVSSKYYRQGPQKIKRKQPQNTRRWGHTKRQHEKKTNGISLNIVANDPYINRLYEIANHLFFSIISKLVQYSPFLKEPLLTENVLRLLATLSSNIKNHLSKYTILSEVVDLCLMTIEDLEKKKNKEGIKSCKTAVLHVLNKISLVVDQYVPFMMLKSLEQCIIKLKKMPEYGVKPVIEMIEANIYRNAVDKNQKL